MRMNRYMRQLETIRLAAERQEEALIESIRTDLLVPFCDRVGAKFTSGMGTWMFRRGKSTQHSFEHDGPFWGMSRMLYTLLHAESAYCNNDLGSMMEDYTPASYKEPKDV